MRELCAEVFKIRSYRVSRLFKRIYIRVTQRAVCNEMTMRKHSEIMA